MGTIENFETLINSEEDSSAYMSYFEVVVTNINDIQDSDNSDNLNNLNKVEDNIYNTSNTNNSINNILLKLLVYSETLEDAVELTKDTLGGEVVSVKQSSVVGVIHPLVEDTLNVAENEENKYYGELFKNNN